MKLFKKISLALMAASSFFMAACSNISGGNSFDSEKTVARISLNEARTVLPDAAQLSDLSNFVLTGTLAGGTEKKLGEWKAVSEITDVELETGTWNFTLKAEENGNKYSASVLNKTIVKGVNSLSFALSVSEYAETGTGDYSFALTINDSEKVKAVTAKLGSDDVELQNSGNTWTASGTGVAAGTKTLSFSIWGDEEKTVLLNTYKEIVRVASGHTSSGSAEISDINEVYTISYENVGSAVLVEDSAVASYSVYSSVTLPSYTKSGYEFLGWYSGDTKVEDWNAGAKSGNVTLTAKWKLVLDVDSVYVDKDNNVTFKYASVAGASLKVGELVAASTEISGTSELVTFNALAEGTYSLVLATENEESDAVEFKFEDVLKTASADVFFVDAESGTVKVYFNPVSGYKYEVKKGDDTQENAESPVTYENLEPNHEYTFTVSAKKEGDYDIIFTGKEFKVELKPVLYQILSPTYKHSLVPMIPKAKYEGTYSEARGLKSLKLETKSAVVMVAAADEGKFKYEYWRPVKALDGSNRISFEATGPNGQGTGIYLYMLNKRDSSDKYRNPEAWGDIKNYDYNLFWGTKSADGTLVAGGVEESGFDGALADAVFDLSDHEVVNDEGVFKGRKLYNVKWDKYVFINWYDVIGSSNLEKGEGNNPKPQDFIFTLTANYIPASYSMSGFDIDESKIEVRDHSVTLAWKEDGFDADYVTVTCNKADSQGNEINVKAAANNDCTVTIENLDAGTEYKFTLTMTDIYGNTEVKTVSRTTAAQAILPYDVTVETPYSNSILVKWNDAAGVSSEISYTVKLCDFELGTVIDTKTVTGLNSGKVLFDKASIGKKYKINLEATVGARSENKDILSEEGIQVKLVAWKLSGTQSGWDKDTLWEIIPAARFGAAEYHVVEEANIASISNVEFLYDRWMVVPSLNGDADKFSLIATDETFADTGLYLHASTTKSIKDGEYNYNKWSGYWEGHDLKTVDDTFPYIFFVESDNEEDFANTASFYIAESQGGSKTSQKPQRDAGYEEKLFSLAFDVGDATYYLSNTQTLAHGSNSNNGMNRYELCKAVCTSTEASPIDEKAHVTPITFTDSTEVGTTSFVLNWTEPADENYFATVITYTVGTEEKTIVAYKGTKSVVIPNLEKGVEYTFEAVSCDKYGRTGTTSKTQSTINSSPVVTGLNATVNTDYTGYVTLTWNENPSGVEWKKLVLTATPATEGEVYKTETVELTSDAAESKAYAFKRLAPNMNYTFTVTTMNGEVIVGSSDGVTGKTALKTIKLYANEVKKCMMPKSDSEIGTDNYYLWIKRAALDDSETITYNGDEKNWGPQKTFSIEALDVLEATGKYFIVTTMNSSVTDSGATDYPGAVLKTLEEIESEALNVKWATMFVASHNTSPYSIRFTDTDATYQIGTNNNSSLIVYRNSKGSPGYNQWGWTLTECEGDVEVTVNTNFAGYATVVLPSGFEYDSVEITAIPANSSDAYSTETVTTANSSYEFKRLAADMDYTFNVKFMSGAAIVASGYGKARTKLVTIALRNQKAGEYLSVSDGNVVMQKSEYNWIYRAALDGSSTKEYTADGSGTQTTFSIEEAGQTGKYAYISTSLDTNKTSWTSLEMGISEVASIADKTHAGFFKGAATYPSGDYKNTMRSTWTSGNFMTGSTGSGNLSYRWSNGAAGVDEAHWAFYVK